MTAETDAAGAPPATFEARLSTYARNALRYWEPRRLIYNLTLGIIVVVHLFTAWPASKGQVTLDLALGVFFLAVLANVCYCAVYPIDLFVQLAGVQETWQKGRVVLLIIGIAFAGVITHFLVLGFLAPWSNGHVD